ncbi:MAG: hypothetical protein H6Q00_1838 [Holophagaceae bacterium]|nr:hypothetical protein [Holophagaceae bacterium]
MPDCELIAECPFFNGRMTTTPALAAMYKLIYCHEDNVPCARHQVFLKLGKPAVPPDLFPHMQDEAETILARS